MDGGVTSSYWFGELAPSNLPCLFGRPRAKDRPTPLLATGMLTSKGSFASNWSAEPRFFPHC
jgi:hypothetical protein